MYNCQCVAQAIISVKAQIYNGSDFRQEWSLEMSTEMATDELSMNRKDGEGP